MAESSKRQIVKTAKRRNSVKDENGNSHWNHPVFLN